MRSPFFSINSGFTVDHPSGEHEGIVVSVQHGVAFIDFYCAGPWSRLVVLLEKMENDKAIYIDRISDTGHNRI